MNFTNGAEKACYDNVGAWLDEIFGEFVLKHEDKPMFAVEKGSATVEISIWPWNWEDGTSEPVVTVYSFVVLEAEITPDLMAYLLNENSKLPFGAFQVNDDGSIVFKHAIWGNTCDKAELKTSVMAVLYNADQYDDEIVGRWGGRTARQK